MRRNLKNEESLLLLLLGVLVVEVIVSLMKVAGG